MTLNSTEKVIRILEAFTPHNEPMGTLQLAEKLSIHRSTVSRILMILKQYGFVQQDKKTMLYRLGPAVAGLGKSIHKSFHHHLISQVQPFLLRMIEQVAESSSLVLITEQQVYVPYRVRGPQPITVSFDHGDRGAINANCGAKAIMAHLPANDLQEIINSHVKLPSFTPHTITEWDELIEQFARIRETGVAYDLEEYNLDVLAMGAPIFDSSSFPVGSITILIPSIRAQKIHDEKILAILKKTAAEISSAMA
jgi:DNA-binding IclR family transcriptional regulator